jgi:hypothetical protein
MASKRCFTCGTPFDFRMPHAKYCSVVCKRRGQRRQGLQGATAAPEPVSQLVEVVIRDLTRANVLDTFLGQLAVELAAAMSSPMSSPSATASLSREFTRVVGAALASTTKPDLIDELKARRDAKRGQYALL